MTWSRQLKKALGWFLGLRRMEKACFLLVIANLLCLCCFVSNWNQKKHLEEDLDYLITTILKKNPKDFKLGSLRTTTGRESFLPLPQVAGHPNNKTELKAYWHMVSSEAKVCKKRGEIQCDDGKRCVDVDNLCDGRIDCQDWSDELKCPIRRKMDENKIQCGWVGLEWGNYQRVYKWQVRMLKERFL